MPGPLLRIPRQPEPPGPWEGEELPAAIPVEERPPDVATSLRRLRSALPDWAFLHDPTNGNWLRYAARTSPRCLQSRSACGPRWRPLAPLPIADPALSAAPFPAP
jgi:hypothetical protein